MKQIVNYIKEAFITKANIDKARKANDADTSRYDIGKLTPFPTITFNKTNIKDAFLLNGWLKENHLFPKIRKINGRKGKWQAHAGVGNVYYISFIFDEYVRPFGDNILVMIEISEKSVDVPESEENGGENDYYDIHSLLQDDSQLFTEVYGLVDCLKKVMDIK